jgi:hypothetical protein
VRKISQFVPSVLVAIAAILASLVCWHLVGELRWGLDFHVWNVEMPSSDRTAIYHAMNVVQGFATILGVFAVIWMALAVGRQQSRWRVVVLVASILSLLLAFIP